jgi:hypothetical protein
MKVSALKLVTSSISSSHATQEIVSLPHKPLTTITFGQTHFLLTPKLCRHMKLPTNLISVGDATSRHQVLCLLTATSGPTLCQINPPGSILVGRRIAMRSGQVLRRLSSCPLCYSTKAVVSLLVVNVLVASILDILVANILAASTPLSDVHQPTLLGILPVGRIRHVKLLVPWTILLIYRHDPWLLWALVHHHLVAVPHGGREGKAGLAGVACHIHNPPVHLSRTHLLCFVDLRFRILSLFSNLHRHTAQFVFSDVIAGVDHLDF